MKIRINKYNISNKYKKKIVLISDIHYCNKSNIKDLNILKEEIIKINPDYICIPGDIIDDKNIKDKDLLINWFKNLSENIKIFISLGNHDFYYNHTPDIEYDDIFIKLDKIKNIYVLDSKIHTEYKINFIGTTLPNDYYELDEDSSELIYYMNKKFNKLDNNLNILLMHSPYQITKKQVLEEIKCHKNIDLILCGHMHAGLAFNFTKKILKGRGIISPKLKLFPKYCYGLHNIDNIKVIISSGIRKLSKSHKLGFLNFLYDSEIIVINI